jgi:hypothetical protein
MWSCSSTFFTTPTTRWCCCAKPGVLKDHTKDGLLAGPTLRFMDWVGNRHHGVVLPYNYWTQTQWERAMTDLGLAASTWNANVGLYPWPATHLFDRALHFVAKLTPNEQCLKAA